MFEKILWATDFSSHATDARSWAVGCARCSQGKLYALTVVDPGDLPVLPDLPTPFRVKRQAVVQAEESLQAELLGRAARRLDQEVEAIQGAGVEVEPLVREGTPWREIVQAARELDVGLIVVGAHGKRGLTGLLLGNTVENVTRHALCPVMVIR